MKSDTCFYEYLVESESGDTFKAFTPPFYEKGHAPFYELEPGSKVRLGIGGNGRFYSLEDAGDGKVSSVLPGFSLSDYLHWESKTRKEAIFFLIFDVLVLGLIWKFHAQKEDKEGYRWLGRIIMTGTAVAFSSLILDFSYGIPEREALTEQSVRFSHLEPTVECPPPWPKIILGRCEVSFFLVSEAGQSWSLSDAVFLSKVPFHRPEKGSKVLLSVYDQQIFEIELIEGPEQSLHQTRDKNCIELIPVLGQSGVEWRCADQTTPSAHGDTSLSSEPDAPESFRESISAQPRYLLRLDDIASQLERGRSSRNFVKLVLILAVLGIIFILFATRPKQLQE